MQHSHFAGHKQGITKLGGYAVRERLEHKFNVVNESRPGKIRFDVTYWPDPQKPPIAFHVRGTDINTSETKWESKLSEEQRLEVFNRILAEYWQLSVKEDLSTAALVVTDVPRADGKGLHTRLYIHTNTTEAIGYHKDCAEVNVTRTMLNTTQEKGNIRELYLITGDNKAPPTRKQDLQQVIPPCGKCSDMLEKWVDQVQNGTVYVLPGNDGNVPLTINTAARTPAGVGQGEVWKIPVHDKAQGSATALLAYRQVDLKKEPHSRAKVKAQKDGWAALIDESRHIHKPNMDELKQRAASGQKLSDDERHLLEIEKAVYEIRNSDRETIATLEAEPSPERINTYMVRQIQETYSERKKAFAESGNGYEEPQKIRCVVVRLADGSFHKGMEVVGKGSNASPPAEMNAIDRGNATYKSVTDVWVMEVDPADIEQNRLTTSTKEGLERLLKRAPKTDGIQDAQGKPVKGTLNIHYIPFNDGTLSRKQVENITISKPFEEFFPSAFIGSAQMSENGSLKTHGRC